MKTGIHPTYYKDAQIVCACGHSFIGGSTKQMIRVEICAKCHPFFTGQQKFVDAVGRIEKFQVKQRDSALKAAKLQVRKAKKLAEQKPREENRPKTLREMLTADR